MRMVPKFTIPRQPNIIGNLCTFTDICDTINTPVGSLVKAGSQCSAHILVQSRVGYQLGVNKYGSLIMIGGKMQDNETVAAAITREWKEETGCDLPQEIDFCRGSLYRCAYRRKEGIIAMFIYIVNIDNPVCFDKGESDGEILDLRTISQNDLHTILFSRETTENWKKITMQHKHVLGEIMQGQVRKL